MVLGIVLVVIGVLIAVEAWLVREGVIQKWPRRYYAATSAPLHVRKGSFGLVPFALMVLLVGGGLIVGNLGGAGGAIALVMLMAAFASFFVAFRWMRKTPEWVKPEWLKRVERGEEDLDHLAAVDGGRRLVAVPPWQYWGTWAFIAVILVLWLVLHLPAAILIGIGFALSVVTTTRPTRDPPDRRERTPTAPAGGRARRSGP